MSDAMRALRAGFVFLTRLPVGGFPYADADFRRAPALFPIVGIAVGAIVAVVHALVLPLGPTAAAFVAIAAGLLVTGAFHEDGLADTADALGGAVHDPERILAILKDSRVGAFGAAALIVSIGLRAALIARLGGDAASAIVLAHALSRTVPVVQIATQPYITDPERSRSSGIAQAGPREALWAVAIAGALLLAALVSGELGVLRGIVLVAALAAVHGFTAWRYRVRAGGICGDFLGATQQLCEATVLAVCVWGAA